MNKILGIKKQTYENNKIPMKGSRAEVLNSNASLHLTLQWGFKGCDQVSFILQSVAWPENE